MVHTQDRSKQTQSADKFMEIKIWYWREGIHSKYLIADRPFKCKDHGILYLFENSHANVKPSTLGSD